MNKFYFVVGLIWMSISIPYFHSTFIWSSIGNTGLTALNAGVGFLTLGVGAGWVWLARRTSKSNED